MTPVELSRTVLCAVRRAVDEGELSVPVPVRVVVERPRPGGCGDYATNVALQLARPAGRTPWQVAEVLRPRLAGAEGVADVAITGPGFLNITLDGGAGGAGALVREVLRRGGRYGYADGPSGQVLQVHSPCEVRAVVVMQVVARLLGSQGALVRTSCEAAPDPAWSHTLGVRVDVHGRPGAPAPLDVNVRPVPAPADPVSLGADAARWALLHPAAHDRPRITEVHLVQRESNPLFRVRYAHARTRALTRNAAELGFHSAPGDVQTDPSGVPALLAALADHPATLAAAARHRAPDRLARHLVVVADALLAFQHTVLPLGDEKPSAAHRARLALAEAAGTVLAGGLSLLGISAPDYL